MINAESLSFVLMSDDNYPNVEHFYLQILALAPHCILSIGSFP